MRIKIEFQGSLARNLSKLTAIAALLLSVHCTTAGAETVSGRRGVERSQRSASQKRIAAQLSNLSNSQTNSETKDQGNRRRRIEQHCLQHLDDPKCAGFLKRHFSAEALLAADCDDWEQCRKHSRRGRRRTAASDDDAARELEAYCRKHRDAPRCAAVDTSTRSSGGSFWAGN